MHQYHPLHLTVHGLMKAQHLLRREDLLLDQNFSYQRHCCSGELPKSSWEAMLTCQAQILLPLWGVMPNQGTIASLGSGRQRVHKGVSLFPVVIKETPCGWVMWAQRKNWDEFEEKGTRAAGSTRSLRSRRRGGDADGLLAVKDTLRTGKGYRRSLRAHQRDAARKNFAQEKDLVVSQGSLWPYVSLGS